MWPTYGCQSGLELACWDATSVTPALAMLIKVHIKVAAPDGSVKKGEVHNAVVVRTPADQPPQRRFVSSL